MAYLMLYGTGWTQRWRIADGTDDEVRKAISQVGAAATGKVEVVDPSTDSPVSLMIAWAQVATAVVVSGAASTRDDSAGQYA
jgi:hypothetical protein